MGGALFGCFESVFFGGGGGTRLVDLRDCLVGSTGIPSVLGGILFLVGLRGNQQEIHNFRGRQFKTHLFAVRDGLGSSKFKEWWSGLHHSC